MAQQLSKSDYMMYLKHPAWLWLKKHEPSKLPPVDENLQAIFDAGHAFEPFAESLFPGGAAIGFRDFSEYRTMPARTQTALDSGVKTLFQGRLEHGGTTCIFDILDRVSGNEFDLYEIKSSTKDKPEHVDDLAFQRFVLEQAGLTIRAVSVIVVNGDYVRTGPISAKELTKVIDLTARVSARLPATKEAVARALEIMRSSQMPDLSPRHAQQHALKEWLAIFRALKLDTDPFSIYALAPQKGDVIGELEDQGIERIKDIPEDFVFTVDQHRRHVELLKLDRPVVHNERIRMFLNTFQFPLHFFDYETMSSVVPPVDGVRPYQELPIQYSLHILREPDGELEHREFLHRAPSNPGADLLRQLQMDMGDTGTVIVWHESFEKSRNDELGEMFPDYANFLERLNDRVMDLKTPFSEHWYEDHRFFGSASIKQVLPVLVPDLSYKALAVQDGQTAKRVWMETVLEGKHQERSAQIFAELLEYCKLDTLAMVRIYQVLAQL